MGAWWSIAAFFFVVFRLILAVIFDQQIYRWYLANFVVPKLEARLGFSTGDLTVPGYHARAFGITRLKPQSPLAQSGFRVGDVPLGTHGGMEEFVGRIERSLATGVPVAIRVLNAYDQTSREVIFQPRLAPAPLTSSAEPVPGHRIGFHG